MCRQPLRSNCASERADRITSFDAADCVSDDENPISKRKVFGRSRVTRGLSKPPTGLPLAPREKSAGLMLLVSGTALCVGKTLPTRPTLAGLPLSGGRAATGRIFMNALPPTEEAEAKAAWLSGQRGTASVPPWARPDMPRPPPRVSEDKAKAAWLEGKRGVSVDPRYAAMEAAAQKGKAVAEQTAQRLKDLEQTAHSGTQRLQEMAGRVVRVPTNSPACSRAIALNTSCGERLATHATRGAR